MFATLNDKFESLSPFWKIVVIITMYTTTLFFLNLLGQMVDFIEKRTILQHFAAAFGAALFLTLIFDRRRLKDMMKSFRKRKY